MIRAILHDIGALVAIGLFIASLLLWAQILGSVVR